MSSPNLALIDGAAAASTSVDTAVSSTIISSFEGSSYKGANGVFSTKAAFTDRCRKSDPNFSKKPSSTSCILEN